MTKPLSVGMISLGCNKNRVDSETALGLLADHGYVFTGDPAQADILMVNTCGFIESAKEESIDAIFEMAEYKKTGRCKLLIVTGCLSQRYEDTLKDEIPEIDLILGVNQYKELPTAIEKALAGQKLSLCQVTEGLGKYPYNLRISLMRAQYQIHSLDQPVVTKKYRYCRPH